MLFGWKKRIIRLHTMLLAGAPLNEIDPALARALEATRGALRGTISREDFDRDMAGIMTPPDPNAPIKHLWEPIELYGWKIEATMYLLDGKPWWLARANHKRDEPAEKDFTMLRQAIDYLGADPERDCIMNTTFGGGRGYGMWWTWINQAPMMELHTTGKGNAFNMKALPEGSPVAPGWERYDRNRIHVKRETGSTVKLPQYRL